MGNARKPRELKLIQGTLRKDRDYPAPEFPPAEDLTAPDWLNGPDAVDEWKRLAGLLSASRVLSEADRTALGHLCNLHGAVLALYRANLQPLAAQLGQLRLMLSDFGLTPASRSKAGTVAVDPKGNAFGGLGA